MIIYRIHTLTLMLSLTTFAALSRTVTPDEALARANAVPQARAMSAANVSSTAKPALVHTQVTEAGEPAAYIFNNAGDTGYMVLAGDDVAWPVLGYSLTGKIDRNSIPPQMQWWLQEYARQIEYARANGAENAAADARPAVPSTQVIEPLIKTHWDQGEPFNGKCPMLNAQRTYTGCVATSMAQVMKYFNYPETGRYSISYNDESGCGKRLSLDFSKIHFDWANMLDNYLPGKYNEAQANAVATLMQAAGYSVRMSYAADASGALAMDISRGLKRFFNYDPNMEYALRSYYSTTVWKQKIIDNLAEVGPVLYGGASMLGGGHSFILDGYDGNGYFHFNWGWSEMSDGYYLLDALNPSALGAGGGDGGGYNFTQDALFGVQPPTGKPAIERPLQLTQQGALTASVTADSLKLGLDGESQCMWVNYNPETMKIRIAALIQSQTNPDQAPIAVELSERPFQVQAGYGIPPQSLVMGMPLEALDLPDGKFSIRICTRDNEVEDSPWVDVRTNYGYAGTVLLDKNGADYTVTATPAVDIKIRSAQFTQDLYIGCSTEVRVDIANNSDIELTRGLAPVLFFTDGSVAFLGQSVLVTLAPGETMTKTWITDFTAMSQQAAYLSTETDMIFTFYDESVGLMYTDDFIEQVRLKANPGMPQLTYTKNPTITNARREFYSDDDMHVKYIYVVSDPSDMQIESAFTLKSGVLAYPIVACVTSLEGEQYAIETYNGYTLFMSRAGQKHDFSTVLNFAQAQPGKRYYLTMALVLPQGLQSISDLYEFTIEDSGVDNITATGSEIVYSDGRLSAPGRDIAVYNLQGALVLSGTETVTTESLAAGVYIARAGGKTLKFTVRQP